MTKTIECRFCGEQMEAEEKLVDFHVCSIRITPKLLKNTKCSVTLYTKSDTTSKPYIIARDLTDPYNLPTISTTKVRALKAAWQELQETFNQNTTNCDVLNIFIKHNTGYHSWCAMD